MTGYDTVSLRRLSRLVAADFTCNPLGPERPLQEKVFDDGVLLVQRAESEKENTAQRRQMGEREGVDGLTKSLGELLCVELNLWRRGIVGVCSVVSRARRSEHALLTSTRRRALPIKKRMPCNKDIRLQ